MDPDHSGNNYIVEASLAPEPDFEVVARSPVYTTWRRVYVEHDKMFKAGEFITQDSGAGTADPTLVFVDEPTTFIDGEQVYLISGESPQTKIGELAIIAANGIQADHIVLTEPLANLYPGNPAFPVDEFPFSFTGRLSAGLWDSQPSLEVLRQTYDDTFTEWAPTFRGSGFVPLWPYLDDMGRLPQRTTAFFDHYNGQWLVPGAQPDRNFVQLMSAKQFEQMLEGSTPGRSDAGNNGVVGPNWSGVFMNTINTVFQDPGENEVARRLVANHELGHQFNVNPPVDPGHDTEAPWDDPTKKCLMQGTLDVMNQSLRFHADPAASTQDLLCVRTHADDLNQDSCPPYSP